MNTGRVGKGLAMNPQVMSEKVDLHYSPDDKGWYLQEYNGSWDRISQVYPTKSKALTAWHSHKVKWVETLGKPQ